MKKTILYMFAAVILGVGIMLFPLWTFFAMHKEEGPITFSNSIPQLIPLWASESWQNFTRSKIEGIPTYNDLYNWQVQSTDLSLPMLAIGFVAAIIVYVIVRRKIPRETSVYRFPQL